jgi:hypothetical protein
MGSGPRGCRLRLGMLSWNRGFKGEVVYMFIFFGTGYGWLDVLHGGSWNRINLFILCNSLEMVNRKLLIYSVL